MLYVGNGLMLVLVVLSLLSRRFLVTTAAMLVKIPTIILQTLSNNVLGSKAIDMGGSDTRPAA